MLEICILYLSYVKYQILLHHSFYKKNILKNRWQSYLLKLWIANDINLLCFCVTVKLHFWLAGPLYLPSKNIDLQLYQHLFVFYKIDNFFSILIYFSSFPVNIISFSVFSKHAPFLIFTFITSFTNQTSLLYPGGKS